MTRKTSICIFKIFLLTVYFHSCLQSFAQTDTSAVRQDLPDSTIRLNMDAAYARPFRSAEKFPVAMGGYLEANTQYAQTDGITDGFTFQARRLTLFFSSTISHRIKFLSEIEFEDGAKEINVEFAAIDIEFDPLLNLRGGIILNPIGAFNQNHDSPRWDFIDRPLSATTIIPSTLSNAGFGLHGKYYFNQWIFGYETYLTNGFDDRVISNSENRTSLAAGNRDPEKFEDNNSGLPMFTGKIALRQKQFGEIGISYLSGVFNKWRSDNLVLDRKRKATVIAIDFNTQLFQRLGITAEAARATADVPSTYSQSFGAAQHGIFIDVVYTFLEKPLLQWDKAKLNAGCRFEFVDYNLGQFRETGGNIGDEIWAIVPTLAFRPAGPTVLRLNYRHEEHKDLLGNPPARRGVIQFGFATYF